MRIDFVRGLKSVEEPCASAEEEQQDGTKGEKESVDDLIEPGHGKSPMQNEVVFCG